MNALDILKARHRKVATLFAELDDAASFGARQRKVWEIAEALAVHSAIEENNFYPSVMMRATTPLLRDALAEHAEIKRVVVDMLGLEPDDASFESRACLLREEVRHHVEEEESELLPRVEKLFSEEALVEIALAMEATQSNLWRERAIVAVRQPEACVRDRYIEEVYAPRAGRAGGRGRG
jgi:hemerythrin superfamily protein